MYLKGICELWLDLREEGTEVGREESPEHGYLEALTENMEPLSITQGAEKQKLALKQPAEVELMFETHGTCTSNEISFCKKT